MRARVEELSQRRRGFAEQRRRAFRMDAEQRERIAQRFCDNFIIRLGVFVKVSFRTGCRVVLVYYHYMRARRRSDTSAIIAAAVAAVLRRLNE